MRRKQLAVLGTPVWFFVLAVLLWTAGCNPRPPDPTSPGPFGTELVLAAEMPALTIRQGEQVFVPLTLVNLQGRVFRVNATPSVRFSNTGKCRMLGNVILGINPGHTFADFTINLSGVLYNTRLAIAVLPFKETQTFSVTPGALNVFSGVSPVKLVPDYYLPSDLIFTYSSSDPSIASIDGSGLVRFNAAGECFITVRALGVNLDETLEVPVLVQNPSTIAVPVAKVVLEQPDKTLFIDDTVSLRPKAFDANGQDITNSVRFTWRYEIRDSSSADDPFVMVVDTSTREATFFAGHAGSVQVVASAIGLSANAVLSVRYDTAMVLTPNRWATNTTNTDSITVSATRYSVDRNRYRASRSNFLIPAPITDSVRWRSTLFGDTLYDDTRDIVAIRGINKSSCSIKLKPNRKGQAVGGNIEVITRPTYSRKSGVVRIEVR